MLKSYEQQRIEQANAGQDIKSVLVGLLIKLRGQPHLVAQASVELKISGPTFRQWCEDMDIDIKGFI
jgi:hypothetical protein